MNLTKIQSLIQSKNYLERIDGYAWLGEHSKETQRKYFVQGISDTHNQVRANIAKFMGMAKDPFYVNHLLTLLHDEKSTVRFCAANSLGYYPKKIKLIEAPLIAILSDKNSTVRMCAAESLGDIKSKRALSFLKKMGEHDANIVARMCAIDSIGYIGDRDNISWLEKLLKKEKRRHELKVRIFTALIELGEEIYFNDLISLLKNKNYRVRLITINALYSIIINYLEEDKIIEILRDHKKIEKNSKCLDAINKGLEGISKRQHE